MTKYVEESKVASWVCPTGRIIGIKRGFFGNPHIFLNIGIVFGLVFTFIIGLIIGYLLVKNKRDKGGRSVMGLKERVKDWYLRPRGSAFFGFVAWVLHSRRAFSVLLVMGHIVTVLFFGFFLLLSFLFGWNWFFRLVLFVFFLLTVRNLWKCLKFFRVSGSSVNASMNEMIYGGRLK